MLVWTFFYFAIRTKPQPYFFQTLLIDAFFGFLVTHTMRFVIKKMGFLNLNLQKQITSILITSLIFALIYALGIVSIQVLFRWELEQIKKYTFPNVVIRSLFSTSLFLLIWNLIYFTYHYIQKNRQSEIDKIRLESLVKELELKTIKSHINPHFIFNALNSIRALVDENPERARTAITSLSNILRSSMQAEKDELVKFEQELNIVKDYLALETVRFEERLRVEYIIDEDTLAQPVPPMMLQTLVENAIKHGISKQIQGGAIKIISVFLGGNHELVVQNTGFLDKLNNSAGFGISSTQSRLELLFGKQAHFELSALNDSLNSSIIQAKITIPVNRE